MTGRTIMRFFSTMNERRFSDAEKLLKSVRRSLKRAKPDVNSEWIEGYIHALNGMMTLLKSGEDPYSLIHSLDCKEKIEKYSGEISRHAENPIHTDFDRGFFSAWSDYMQYLRKRKPSRKAKQQRISQRPEDKPQE